MPASLRLADFSDDELFYALEEAADENGLATAGEVATAIGIDAERPAQNVGARFAALRRMGLMAKAATSPQGDTLWRISEVGAALRSAKMGAALTRALSGLDEAARVRAIDEIARQLPGGSRQSAHLARRAYAYRFGMRWRDPKLRRNGR